MDDGCLHRPNVPVSLYSNKHHLVVKDTFPSGSVPFYVVQAASVAAALWILETEHAAPGQDNGFSL